MENNLNLTEKTDLPLIDESIESIGKSTKNYLKQHPILIWGSLGIVVVAYIIIFSIPVLVPQLLALPAFGLLAGYLYLMQRIRHEFMRQFAAANGFFYAAKGTLDDMDGTLFQIGHGKSVTDVVSGQFHDCELSIFTYQYTTGEGRSAQKHNYTIFKFHLNAAMPDIVLENKSHPFGDSILNYLKGSESLVLEGDFNKYFNLNVSKGYEIEALQVFSPDVMAEIEDKCRSLSLEIVNSYLYIYRDGEMNTKKDLYALYDCAKYFEEKLAPLLSRMKPALEEMLKKINQ